MVAGVPPNEAIRSGLTLAARIAKHTTRDGAAPEGLPSPCWLWTGALDPDGYGVVSVGRKARQAHIASYEDVHGAVPEGLELDHRCRVRNCVNPEHLEAITHAENVWRAAAAQNREKRVSTVSPAEVAAKLEEIERLKAAYMVESPLPDGVMKETLAESLAQLVVAQRELVARELRGEHIDGDTTRRLASGPSNIKRLLSELGLDSKKNQRKKQSGFLRSA